MITGLKFKFGKTIKTANINVQAVPQENDPLPIANAIATVTPVKGAGNVDKKVIAAVPVKQGMNLIDQQNVANKFVKPQITIPYVKVIPKNTLNFQKIKKADLLKTKKIIPIFKKPAILKGISEQRPEILALTDFKPIYVGRSSKRLNAVGQAIDFQIAARRMRIDNIMRLLDALNETEDAKEIMNELKDDYIDNINKARADVEFLVAMSQSLASARNALNFRRITSVSSQLLGTAARNYRAIFTEELGFTEEGYNEFSNTKVFGQYLFDLRTISQQYSPALLDAFDEDRNKDTNPVSFAKEIDVRDGKFSFRVDKLAKKFKAGLTLGKTTRFIKFITSLPKDLDDRAKVLILTLSKEMRVSDGLGDVTVNKILEKTFASPSPDEGNPFDDIIGRPGEIITDEPVGDDSLCQLMRFTDDDTVILPFERTLLVAPNNRTYFPGTEYLVDGLVSGDPPFDRTRFLNYMKTFEKRTTDMRTIYDKVFNLNNSKRDLYADDLLFGILSDLLAIMEVAANDNKLGVLLPVALMRVGNSDKKLKSMLYQYMLLLGFNGQPVGGEAGATSPNEFFERISDLEIEQFVDLTELDGLSAPEAEEPESPFDVPDFFQPFNENTPTSDILAVRSAIIALREKIVKRAKNSVKNGAKANFGALLSPLHFTTSELEETLANNSQIFQMMGEFILNMENLTKSENGHLLDDGRTRYNRLTGSTVAAFVFEAYSALATKYIKAGFTAATVGSIILKVDIDSVKELLESVKENLGVIANSIKQSGFGGGGLKLASPDGPLVDPKILKFILPQQKNQQQQQGKGGLKFKNFGQNANKILADSLSELREKLAHEDDLIREMVERLSKSTDRIIEAFDNLEEFFDPKGPNKNKLDELVSGEDADEKLPLISDAQIRLSQKALADLEETDALSLRTKKSSKKKGFELIELKKVANIIKKQKPVKKWKKTNIEVPAFFDDSEISQEIQAMLFLLLDQRKYRRDRSDNLKILSVGLPAGFLENIHTAIETTSNDFDDVNDREKDIIAVNVYKRDIEYEEIVFKPISYIFEMSRFVSRSTFDANADAITQGGFNVVRDSHVFMRDFSRFVKGQKSTGENIFNDGRYDFLSQREKESLVENHMASFLLGLYIQLLTGVSMDESEYFMNTSVHAGNLDDGTQARFERLIELYISGIAGKPVTLKQLRRASPELNTLLKRIKKFGKINSLTKQVKPPKFPGVSRSAAIELTEDLISFVKTFHPHSFLTGGSAHRQQITSPKMFERIFNVPVDPDDFEIDVEKTMSTTAGKRAYFALLSQGRIIEKLKPVEKTQGKKLFFLKFGQPENNKAFFIRPRPKNQTVAFDEFFVTVSTVGDFVV